MFCLIFIILHIYYTTSTLVFPTIFNQYNDSTTCFDCQCDTEIDVVQKFLEDLDVLRKRADEIVTEISIIHKQLRENRKSKPTSCMEAAAGRFKSGIYYIQLEKFDAKAFAVWCNEDIEYGGWLVIQRRESDALSFYRGWQDYKDGFGVSNGNYWMGLEKLHVLTTSCEQELYVEMKRFNGENYYAKYSEFVIGNESENYALKKLGSYVGNSNDSLTQHVGKPFTTFNRDNDASANNCASMYQSGWWFEKCYNSNLNGVYRNKDGIGDGVDWNNLKMNESLKFTQMMIRPTENCLMRMSLRN